MRFFLNTAQYGQADTGEEPDSVDQEPHRFVGSWDYVVMPEDPGIFRVVGKKVEN